MKILDIVKVGVPTRPGLRFVTDEVLPNGEKFIELFAHCTPMNLKAQNESLIVASVAIKDELLDGRQF